MAALIDHGTNDIYDTVIECTTLFESLAEKAELDHGKKDTRDEKGVGEMEKSFNIWIDYTGALAADVSRSLDTRLHAHRDIKEMVTDLLQMLLRNLEYLHKGDGVKPHVPSGDSGNNSDADELKDEARYAIQKALDELHFMAAAIRRSSVRSQRYNLSSHFHRDDDSSFQEQACLLVRYYFRDARRSLCDQLGTSLAMRRSKFFQRMRHEEKLSIRRSPEESKHPVKPAEGPVTRLQQLSPLDAEGSQANLPKQKVAVRFKALLGSGDTGSQLDSVAARHHLKQGPALSAISMGSSIRLSSATYPDKPKFADGDRECTCPYCARRLMTIRLKNEPKYWQNHMDEDTEPYVCLSEECTSPTLFFVHMKDWMSHMETFHSGQWNRKIHMGTWYCDIGHTPAIQFNNRESFVRHMKDPANHKGREPPTDLQLDTLSRNKQRILVRDDEYCCPLCECVPSALEQVIVNSDPDKIRHHLYKHIAAHIKDLAFKSIPVLDGAEPSEHRQSEVDDGDYRQLRGDNSAASYPSGLDRLRGETSVAFGDSPDQGSVGTEDEAYNVDYYNMDRLATLWDNPGFVEHWGHKAAPDPGKPDAILDHFARSTIGLQNSAFYSIDNRPPSRSERFINPQARNDEQYLKDLCVTDPRDDKKRIQDTKGGLLTDCDRWILDNNKFRRWRDDSQTQLLWIKGGPGSGKTMLLCAIIDELEKEPGNCVSYYFCQAADLRLNNATAVLRGLIYLLVCQQPSLISHVQGKYDLAGKQLFEDGNAWAALSRILLTMLNDRDLNDAILIIDALDECRTDLSLLLEFIARPSRAKWIVSSRNQLHVEKELRKMTPIILNIELHHELMLDAVDTYVTHMVNQLAHQKEYDKRTRDLVNEYLKMKSDGTFLWVALACQELAKVTTGNTLNSLELIPAGLYELYDKMLNSVRAVHCRKILAVASVVYRPITLDELKVLVESLENFDRNDMEDTIRSCGSFLTLRGGVIYFVHQTAKDFLLNKAEILDIGVAQQHHAIFVRSLGALSQILRRDVYGLRAPGLSINQVSTPHPDPLASIRYSCEFWVDHLGDSEYQAQMNATDLGDQGIVHSFLRIFFLCWLESLSLLHSISDGVTAVQKLEALVKPNEAPQLIKLLRDARRFILSHKQAIKIAPLQVYALAVVFNPTNSVIRQLFISEEPDWVILKPSVESDSFNGHDGSVNSMAFSADGQRLASGAFDKTIKVWDAATGACMQTLNGHSGEVLSVAFSADGQRLASGSYDTTIKVWDAATGACMQTLKGHSGEVLSVAFSSDDQRLASGSFDATVKVWDVLSGACLQTLEGRDKVTSVAFSSDDQRLASGSFDATLNIWDLATGVCVQTLEDRGEDCSEVISVALSADDRRVASGSFDGTVKVWDIITAVCVQTLEAGTAITHLSFDPLTDNRLSTNIGLLDLDVPDPPPAINSQSAEAVSRGMSRSGHGISTDGKWIVKDEERILWLPREYRASASAVAGSAVAIGCRSGRVLMMKFS